MKADEKEPLREQWPFCLQGRPRQRKGYAIPRWYCATQGNAMTHRERVKCEIPENCCVTLILVADKQSEYLYNNYGRHPRRKKGPEMPQQPDLIEFF